MGFISGYPGLADGDHSWIEVMLPSSTDQGRTMTTCDEFNYAAEVTVTVRSDVSDAWAILTGGLESTYDGWVNQADILKETRHYYTIPGPGFNIIIMEEGNDGVSYDGSVMWVMSLGTDEEQVRFNNIVWSAGADCPAPGEASSRTVFSCGHICEDMTYEEVEGCPSCSAVCTTPFVNNPDDNVCSGLPDVDSDG